MPPNERAAHRAVPGAHWAMRGLEMRPGTLPWIVLAVALILVYGIDNWLPKAPPKPDPTWTRMLQDGVLRIGIDPSFPPFERDDGKGNLSGLDIAMANELVREWSTQTGVPIRIQWVYSGFDGLYDALISDQFDIILSALPYNAKKTEDVRFSHSYYNGGPLTIVRQGDEGIDSWKDLEGKRVGVELGSSGDSFARRWEKRLDLDLKEFDTPTDALGALTRGQIDGVFTDDITYQDFRKVQDGVKSVGDPVSDEFMVLAVRKNASTLLAQINAVIDAMKTDGRMEKLQEEWF